MLAIVIFLAAVLPSLLIVAIFLRYDRFPEPRGVVTRTFLLGMVVIAPLVIVNLAFTPLVGTIHHPVLQAFFQSFFMAGTLEEVAKFWVLYSYCMKNAAFNEPMDGLVYGMTASLGFACLENISYVASAGDQWLGLAIARGLLAVPSHGFNGAIMGYYAARARFNAGTRAASYRKALLVPIILHGSYDFSPLLYSASGQGESDPDLFRSAGLVLLLAVGIVLFEVRWTLRLFRRHREEQFLPPPLPSSPAPAHGEGPASLV